MTADAASYSMSPSPSHFKGAELLRRWSEFALSVSEIYTSAGYISTLKLEMTGQDPSGFETAGCRETS